MFLFRVTLIAFLWVSMFGAYAQEEEPANQTSETNGLEQLPTQIAVVAVGPKPPRRFGEKGQMLLPSPGEVPPSRLYYKGEGGGEDRPNWTTFNVPFNNPAAMKDIEPEKGLVLYRKDTKSDDYLKYATIPAGELGSRRVFFLIPSSTGKTLWNRPPLVRTINLDSQSLQGKQFVLKNLSNFTVLHAFQDSVRTVQPMKTIAYTRPKSGELFRLAARYGSLKKIIYNTAVKLDKDGHIQLFALYNASPKTNSGKSVGVFRMMIPARPDPVSKAP